MADFDRVLRGPWVIVHLNDARVIGSFESEEAAYAWAKAVPNALFPTEEEWEHADVNGDFWATKLEVVR